MADDRHVNAKILIYDGGMGTTLEDEFKADLSSALWSSTLLQDESNGHRTLKALHTAFLNAGADLIQSCTYQCSFEGFRKQGYSEMEAIELMRKAVSLAAVSISANSHYSAINKGKFKQEPGVVLALSCYGAILNPGQEYSGRYPPPFGHPAHAQMPSSSSSFEPTSAGAASSAGTAQNINDSWMRDAENSLEEWHFERLKVFAADPKTWSRISYVAFETLPVLYEGRAIRRAMTRLKHYMKHHNASSGSTQTPPSNWPKWWISFVFPNGQLPYTTSLEMGDISPLSIAKTMFEQATQHVPSEGGSHVPLETPDGLGINCTKMHYLPKIIKEYTAALQETSCHSQEGSKRTLVVYPDGGLVYDPVTKSWHQDGVSSNVHARTDSREATEQPSKVWASDLVAAARNALYSEPQVWDSAILGGCCKASPAYIAELARKVANTEHVSGSAGTRESA